MRRMDWRLCFIADSEAAGSREILPLIVAAVAGGATLIQLRGKTWTGREFFDLGIQARQFLHSQNIPFVINDRVGLALACKADGVHLGQQDMPLSYAREILGENRIIGISVVTPDEAEAAEKAGADYVGVGPIFRTLSKVDAGPILGLDGLRRIREKIKIPILAIGGISASNVADVVCAGADGVAVISAIAATTNPGQEAARIIAAIGELKKRTD